MTSEAQRIAIAEACGWSDIERGPYDGAPFGRHKTHQLEMVPDYLNDLNAMHEAEKVLLFSARQEYTCLLQEILGRPVRCVVCEDAICFATAAQRAEAFLRTIGKWVD